MIVTKNRVTFEIFVIGVFIFFPVAISNVIWFLTHPVHATVSINKRYHYPMQKDRKATELMNKLATECNGQHDSQICLQLVKECGDTTTCSGVVEKFVASYGSHGQNPTVDDYILASYTYADHRN